MGKSRIALRWYLYGRRHYSRFGVVINLFLKEGTRKLKCIIDKDAEVTSNIWRKRIVGIFVFEE